MRWTGTGAVLDVLVQGRDRHAGGLRGMGNRNGQLDAGSFLADTGMARTKSQVWLVIHPRRDRMDIETYLARLNFHAMPKPGLSFDNSLSLFFVQYPMSPSIVAAASL
jgi:hypothetical protein